MVLNKYAICPNMGREIVDKPPNFVYTGGKWNG